MPRKRRPPRPGALADVAPLRILGQIVLLQLVYYASAIILIVFTTVVAGRPVRAKLLLSWRTLRGDTTTGWTLAVAWMLNSLISIIPLLLFVARSKLIPDFALTIHFIHLVLTSLYTHKLPRYWFWWALQAASAALMTTLGVWSCQWRELRPINFGTSHNRTNQAVERGSQDLEAAVDGPSHGRSHAKGSRGGDSSGQYEMVGMASQDENV